MEPTPLTLTERIVYLKKCAGSLRRLDKAAGLKPGYCHALVARIDNPHLSTLHKIADGAGVARSWVTNGDGPLPPAEGIRSAVAAACADVPDEDEGDVDEAALSAPALDPPRVILPGLDPNDPEPQVLASPEWYAWMERENARIAAEDDPYAPAKVAAAKAKLAAEDAKRAETVVKAMLARKAERDAAEAKRDAAEAEAAKKRVA